MTMKQARALLVLFFVSLTCSASSLPIEMVSKFFVAQSSSMSTPLSTGGFAYLSEGGMSSSSPGAQFIEVNIDPSCNFILASVGTLSGSIPTLTISVDGSGTFFPALGIPTNGDWPSNQIYYCTNYVRSGTATRFTSSGPGTWAISQFVSSNGVPQFLSASQNGSSSWTTIQPGAITASGTNFYFASATHDNGSAGYIDTGWTNIVDGGGTSGQDVPLTVAACLVTNTTQNPTATNNAGSPVKGVAAMAMFAAYGSPPVGCSPSYANTGGTGDRRAIISMVLSTANATSITSFIDGDNSSNGRNFWNGNALDGSSFYLVFDFGSGNAVRITEAKYYQQDGTDQGTWKWQGSNDASAWTDIGGNFSLATAATTTLTTLSGNTTAYRYYKLLGMSGATSNGPWIYQFEFKTCGLP